jgi:hypothetical protein
VSTGETRTGGFGERPVLGKPERYFAADHVRYAWVDDRIVILDLRTESYFALDPTASSMWRELTAPYAADAGLRRLEQRYAVEPAQLAADFDAFTSRCVEAEWLVDVEPVPPPRPRAGGRRRGRWPLTLQAWWTLLAITRSLAARGFASTYARLSRPASAREIRADAQDELLSTAMRAFSRAEQFVYLKRAPADCLPRSLALFEFLRSLGLTVDHRIGVRQFPFAAHAWTEHRGHVVHDDPENISRYTVIASLPT